MHEFLFACNEPDGVRIRCVKPLRPDDIPRVYASIRASHLARGKDLPPDVAAHEFARVDKLYWTVDDVGLLIANTAGDVHVFFWDKRLRGREGLCRGMAHVFMAIIERSSVWTQIPEKERAVIAFAKRVGFEQTEIKDGLVTLIFRR